MLHSSFAADVRQSGDGKTNLGRGFAQRLMRVYGFSQSVWTGGKLKACVQIKVGVGGPSPRGWCSRGAERGLNAKH